MSQTQPNPPPGEIQPLPLKEGTPEREEYEAIPWTGITLVLAVIGLLLFMAVPMQRLRQKEMLAMQRDHSAQMALEELSRAIEAYHNDHGAWPGARPSEGGALGEPVFEVAWLERQLGMFTNGDGFVVPQFLMTHPWGPYLRSGIPTNPANGLRTVYILQADERVESVESSIGWIYDPRTGRVIPGDRTRMSGDDAPRS